MNPHWPLPSIVGKGNHSADHIQKIKPAVENICRELGLQYNTEHNEDRIYINLTGGEAIPPSHQDGAPSSKYSQEQQGQYQSAYPLGGYAGQSQQYATQHHQYTNGQETYAQAAGGQQQQPQYAGKQTQQQGQQQQQFDYQEEGKEETGCLPMLINLLKKCFS